MTAATDQGYTSILFEQLVGVSLQEVSTTVSSRKRTLVGECLESSGFPEFASGGPREHLELLPPQVGGYPSYIAERIGLEEADGISSMAAPSVELERAWTKCQSAADAEVADPVAIYSKWLSAVGADLEARLKADSRYIGASEQRLSCFVDAGYSESDADPLLMSSVSIYNAFRRGALTATEAIDELDSLSESESPAVRTAARCNDAFIATRDLVYNQLLNDYLDANAELLSEIGKDLMDAIGRLNK